MPRVPHAKRGDLDNYCKGIIDALNKLLWLDDGQVSKIEASKWIASGEERPHVEITVKIHGES